MYAPVLFNRTLSNDFFNDFFGWDKMTAPSMAADIKEYDDKYELELSIPGYRKEDITVELKDEVLTVTASRNDEKEEKAADGRYLRRERYTGSVKRSFTVGRDVTENDIRATFENGILTLTIAKKEPALPEKRLIAIEG